ncbi:MAG: Trehalose/maltose import ATP-binding protein MalK [Candidatus Bathyarchaeota archaeon BA1]|nr:MAG: Trehalose/maltose import ATP-binding protein MalK [Candidatus Bathyarchaeota archaeon BA1]
MHGSQVVEVRNLVKRFGELVALNDVSFKVDQGEIFGLIGPNGAGKTTALRILATLLLPTSGHVRVLGYDVVREADKVRPLMSYLAEDAGAYRNLSGYEYLSIVAQIYFESRSDAEEAVEEAVKISGLGDRIMDKIKNYSKGMKRRIQVARALMTKPKLAILDEPTAGLDVFHAQHVRGIVKRHVLEGRAVVLSSHNMLEVEYLCSRLTFIHQGKIMIEGEPQSLKEKCGASNLEEAFMEVIGRWEN